MGITSIKINQRALMAELSASDAILKREADKIMMEQFFMPAVRALNEDFEQSSVTREIAGGIDSSNISNTLEAPFREDEDSGDTKANLFGFIGFDQDPSEVLTPIRQRLDPNHPDGPKMIYRGRDKDKLTYRYEIKAPNEEAIYGDTGLPWAAGISWVKRIEQGLPGIGQFLNVANRPSSRSGGGIQVKSKIRSGRYRPTTYLTRMVTNFLQRATGGNPR
jgi:hypothetical protein